MKNRNGTLAKKLKMHVFAYKRFQIVLWGIPKDSNRPSSGKIVIDNLHGKKIKNPNRQLAKKLKIQVFDSKLFPIVLWGIPKDTNRPLSRKIVMDHLPKN